MQVLKTKAVKQKKMRNKRVFNPQPPDFQAGTLTAELQPLFKLKIHVKSAHTNSIVADSHAEE